MSEERDFDKAAAEWDDKPHRRELADAVAAGIAEAVALRSGMRALEYGCGTGLVGLQLAARLGHLTAADASPGMLKVLQEKCAALGIGNVTAQPVPHDGWTLPDAAFDLVFSSMLLHHVADTAALLENFCRSLKPGGIMALADLEQEDGSFHDDPTGVAHHGFDVEKLVDMLSKLGFVDLQRRTVHFIRKQQGELERGYPVFLVAARKVSP